MSTTNLKQAVRILDTYTESRFDPWILSGRSNAKRRAHVMSVLVGMRMPQNKSGVFALRSEFLKRAGIEGHCMADSDEQFVAFCCALLAEREVAVV